MVRLHLEWGPHTGDMKAVERVQKRATKMIPNLHYLSYRERLEILNLSSLYHMRRRGDMIMCFKIITKRINIDAKRLLHFKQRKDERSQIQSDKEQTCYKISQMSKFRCKIDQRMERIAFACK